MSIPALLGKKVKIANDLAKKVVSLETFESLMTAIELRHLAFHARSGTLIEGSMNGEKMKRRINLKWSGVDSFSREDPQVKILAENIIQMAYSHSNIEWKLSA
jgi:hypothetical protein